MAEAVGGTPLFAAQRSTTPGKASRAVEEARSLVRDGRWQDAVELLVHAAAQDTEEFQVFDELTTILHTIAVSRRLVQEFYERLGWSFEKHEGFAVLDPSHRWIDTNKNLADALDRLAPSKPWAALRLQAAEELRLQDALDEAIDAAMDIERRCSEMSAEASFVIGSALLARGQLDEARGNLEKASHFAPLSGDALGMIGRMLYRAGEGAKAAKRFDEALILSVGTSSSGKGLAQDWPTLCLEGYKGYNVLHYRNHFFAVPQAIGEIDFDRNTHRPLRVRFLLPVSVRIALKRMLSARTQVILRRAARILRLDNILHRKEPLTNILEGDSLEAVLEMIDGPEEDGADRTVEEPERSPT